jgi:hypothetical protein
LSYLNELRQLIKLDDSSIKDEFLEELNTHIEEKSNELREAGISEEEARKEALESLGPAKLIARQFYEVYSQGTWKQAFFCALPHIIVALLFAFNLFPNIISLISLVSVGIIICIWGWSHGKPTWLFPWLGCLLSPAIIVGLLLIYLPNGWTWFAALSYIPLAGAVLFLITRQTLKRDWLFVSLMMLPVPVVLGWVFSLSFGRGLLDTSSIYETAWWIGLSFAILALAVMFFIRVKQRTVKALVLLVPELLVMVMVFITNGGAINIFGWVILVLLTVGLIMGPYVLERRSKLPGQRLL